MLQDEIIQATDRFIHGIKVQLGLQHFSIFQGT
jgi:hypothetical protein